MSDLDDIGLYVPARNAAPTLEPCLEAIARLDPAPREVVVVVDSASHDGTVAIARGRRGIRVVEQRRRGLPAARNEALRALEAPWVASVDADVVVDPQLAGPAGGGPGSVRAGGRDCRTYRGTDCGPR